MKDPPNRIAGQNGVGDVLAIHRKLARWHSILTGLIRNFHGSATAQDHSAALVGAVPEAEEFIKHSCSFAEAETSSASECSCRFACQSWS